MQFLALATGVLTLALLLAIFTTNADSAVVARLAGSSPPSASSRSCSASRRRRSCASGGAHRSRRAASRRSRASSPSPSRRRRSPPACSSRQPAIVGARAIAIRNAEGARRRRVERPGRRLGGPRARPTQPALSSDASVVELEVPRRQHGRLDVAVRAVLRRRGAARCCETLGALTGLALDRVRLFQAEHEARLAARARERGEDELHRARRARAAHADDDDPRLRHDAAPPRRPARRRAARDRARRADPADRSAWRDSSSSSSTSRGSTPTRSRSRRSACDVRSQVEEIVDAAAADPESVEDVRRMRRDGRPQRARPRDRQSGHERLPLRHRRRDPRRADRPPPPDQVEDRGSGVRRVRPGPVRAVLAQRGLARRPSAPASASRSRARTRARTAATSCTRMPSRTAPASGSCLRSRMITPSTSPSSRCSGRRSSARGGGRLRLGRGSKLRRREPGACRLVGKTRTRSCDEGRRHAETARAALRQVQRAGVHTGR